MKKLIKIVSLLLIVCISLTAVACSSYGKLEKALTDNGYAVIQAEQGDKDAEKAEQMEQESDVAVKVHLFTNKDSLKLTEIANLNVVFVFEFNSTDDMKEFYEDSNTLQGFVKDVEEDGTAQEFYDALVEKGLANGNCLVFGVNPFVAESLAEIVKNA